MRVLVVTNMWPTASDPVFGVFVAEQVDRLRDLGVVMDVAFIDGRAGRANYLRCLPQIRRRLRAGGYDVVHAHYVLSGVVAWLAGARGGRPPLVVTHHGIEVFVGWQGALARWLTRRATRTLVINPAMAARLGLGPAAVVPCGVDLERFQPGPRAAARDALGLPAEGPVVAWVGQDRPEKRLRLARAAVECLRITLPDAELLVASHVPHAALPCYLHAADVLLVTSTFEGGPLVVKEALACDVPVVSTDVGDVQALIGGLEGCAVVADDPATLARALRRAIAHGPVEGRPVVAPFAADAVARRVRAVYDDVLGQRRR